MNRTVTLKSSAVIDLLPELSVIPTRKRGKGGSIMIDEVLAAIRDMLPERIFILLPNNADPNLVLYSDECKATVRIDNNLAVFVVVGRHDGELITWGEGATVMDATRQALGVLRTNKLRRESSA